MLADELSIGRLAAEILARRGLTDPAAARDFLHPDYRVHSPYLLDGMAEARKRIDRALGDGETIAVYGDYDADGITATFLLAEFLGTRWAPRCYGGCPTGPARATASLSRRSTSSPAPAPASSSPSTAGSAPTPRSPVPVSSAST